MDKELDRLCRGYRSLKANVSYSDKYLELTEIVRKKVYSDGRKYQKDEVFQEVDCLLDYLEYGLFNYYYAQKNPKRLIGMMKTAHENVASIVDEEAYVEVVDFCLLKLQGVYREIRRRPHYNENKFGPTKKAIKELEGVLERLNMPSGRNRKLEKNCK